MRACAVLPTYNEATTLEPVVRAALAATDDLDVLIVDDASPDGTGALAVRLAADDARVHVLHRADKQGLGSAYRQGFRWGLSAGYEALCSIDADGSHDPADLGRLLAALASADLAVGSRWIPEGAVVNWPARRRLLSQGGNRYVRWCTGLPVADATSGLRAYRAPLLAAIVPGVRAEGYAFQVEMALRAWQQGFRVVELPITFVERWAGVSKLSRAVVIEAVLRVAVWGAVGPRRVRGVHPDSAAASASGPGGGGATPQPGRGA